MKKVLQKNEKVLEHNYSSDEEQEWGLLDYDKTSSEEEILGESFNILYKDKFVPGNKIHKELAGYENQYRKFFYEEDQGLPRKAIGNFVGFYEEIETKILKQQKEIRVKKKKFKEDLYKNKGDIQELKDSQKYQDQKKIIAKTIETTIGMPYILAVKQEQDQPNNVYPNFAVAKLSYIKNNKIISQLIKINREIKIEGHSEKQIFIISAEIIQQKQEKYQNSELVILDVHTALSMCTYGNTSCYQEANKLISFIEKLIGEGKFKIRVSYNFPYSKPVQKGDDENLFQKQIEVVDMLFENTILSPDSIVISSGYTTSTKHKNSVDSTDTKLEKLLENAKKAIIKEHDTGYIFFEGKTVFCKDISNDSFFKTVLIGENSFSYGTIGYFGVDCD